MTPIVAGRPVTRRYRGMTALDDVTVELAGEHHHRSAGPQRRRQVHPDADHHRPGVRHLRDGPGRRRRTRWRTTPCSRRMIFVKESQIYPDIKVKRALGGRVLVLPELGRRTWPVSCGRFRAAGRTGAIKKLSRGMHSAVGIVIGLAARAEITLFDEPYLGLDAVARQIFYDRLLADYAEHPADGPAVHPPHRRGGQPARARHRHRPRPDRGRRRRRRPARPGRHGQRPAPRPSTSSSRTERC